MRRAMMAAVAAVMLILAIAPSSFAVVVLGTLDQSAAPGTTPYLSDWDVSQTFTAGRTGLLTQVQLYCDSNGGGDVSVSLSVGTSSGDATCGNTPGWADFVLISAIQVVAGQQYTIAHAGGQPFDLYVTASDYAGGAAAANGNPITDPVVVSDFAFQTYVYNPSTTTYLWSAPQVSAGSTTTVTLTAVTAFQAVVSPGVVSGDQSGMVSPDIPLDLNYTVTLGALPAWFTPTGIACSAQIATADCTIANFKTGLSATGDGTAMTVTVVVTGQASPAAADVGSSGTASGQGCVVNTTEPLQDPIEPQQEQVSICSSATAGLAVAAPIATPAPSITPPPTATDASGTSGDAPVPWLAAALLALFCSLVLVSVRRVGQRR